MKEIKIRAFNFLMLLLLLTLLSCSKEDKNIYEAGHKVISLVEAEVDSPVKIVVDPTLRSQIKLKAEIDNLSAYGIVVDAEVKPDLVEEFNRKHNTDYQELSSNSYTFESSKFIFPKYSETSSQVIVDLSSSGMENYVEYLLPIQLINLTGDEKATINAEKNTAYFIVSKLSPPQLIYLKDQELTTEVGADKKNWFSAFATNSEGGHTFNVKEAAEQSHMMDFVLLKFGQNLRLHPSIIGWQHGGDYQRYLFPYIQGFEKLSHVTNMNRIFTTDVFESMTSSEELVEKVAQLRVSENYNFYVADRMTSHNIQTQINGSNRVLMQGWGPRIAVNSHFMFLYIKEVVPINGGADYTIKFDVKYIDYDIKNEVLQTEGQTTIVNHPGYNPLNEMVEYKGVEITSEIGEGKKNWFSAYANESQVTFTQQEAKQYDNMMDFTLVLHPGSQRRFYSPSVGEYHGDYKERIEPYIEGFKRLSYTMLGGWRGGTADATKPEHYESVTDVESLTELIIDFNKTYGYPNTDRMVSDDLGVNRVGVFGWGNHDVEVGTRFANNNFGIFIIRELEQTNGDHYRVVLDIKVPKHNVRSLNNKSLINK